MRKCFKHYFVNLCSAICVVCTGLFAFSTHAHASITPSLCLNYTQQECINNGFSWDTALNCCVAKINLGIAVTYDNNGGSGCSSETVDFGRVPSCTPTRTGYSFDGWYTSATGGTEVILVTSTGDITLYAHWTPITYNITYYLDGGTNNSNNPQTYTINSPSTILESPNKTGYDFIGWCTDSDKTNCSTTVRIGDGQTGNKAFYAKWAAKKYSLTYSCGEGTGTAPSNTIVTYDTSFTPADNTCTRARYTFAGWSDGNTTRPAGTAFTWKYTTSKTFTAKWTPITITCTSGYYLPANTTQCVKCPTNSYCGGGNFTFSESTTQGVASCPANYPYSEVTSTSSNKCYRQCTYSDVSHSKSTGTFTGIFYSNNTNACEPVNDASCADGYHYKEGSTGLNVDASIAPTSIRYKSVDGTGNNSSDTTGLNNGDWDATFSYGNITGKALCSTTNGSFGETGTPDESGSGQYCWCQIDGFTPTNGSKQSLLGTWVFFRGDYIITARCAKYCAYDCADGLQDLDWFRTALLGSANLPAICEANTYTVQFNSNSATTTGTMDPIICTYGSDCVLTNNAFTNNGYIFKGWKLTSDTDTISYQDGANVLNLTNTNNGVVTLYAEWKYDCNTITLDKNDGSGETTTVYQKSGSQQLYSDNTCTTSLSDNKITPPTRSGYTFNGYGYQQSGGPTYINSEGIINWTAGTDGTLYAHWTPNCNTITLDGTQKANQIPITTGKLYKLTDSTLWYTDASCTGTPVNTLSDANIIRKILLDTSGIDTFLGFYSHGPVSKGGHTITDKQIIDSDGVLSSSLTFDSDKTIYPHYTCKTGYTSNIHNTTCTPNTITFKYETGGHGTTPTTPTSCEYENTIFDLESGKKYSFILPSMSEEGYTFDGWSIPSDNSSSILPAGSLVSCTENDLGISSGEVTFTGNWTPTTYTITYNLDGGQFTSDEDHPTTYNITTPSTLIASPEKSGYTFAGWCTDTARTQNCSTTVRIGDGNTGDITLYAKWEVCPAGYYCTEGTQYACPTPDESTAMTTYTEDFYANENLRMEEFYIHTWTTGLTSKSECPAIYAFRNNRGYCIYENTKFNTNTGKYDLDGDFYYTNASPGYYLYEKYSDSYCNTETKKMIYRKVAKCPAGYYCPGYFADDHLCNSGTYESEAGKNQCPARYPNSDEGAKTVDECYRQCTASDVAHSKSTGTFTGMFYSNNTNTCIPVNDASCADGYHYTAGSTGLNLDASINGDSSNGDSSTMTWNTTFSYGNITGKALCSPTSGGKAEVGNPDESVRGANCWCQIDGYTPVNGSKQSLSGAWVFRLHDVDNDFCADDCATNCAISLQEIDGFRATMLSSVSAPASAMCEVDTYNITYNLDGGTNYTNAPTTYTINSDTIILEEPTKEGFSFEGWIDIDENTVTEITSGSTGDIVLTALWIDNTITCPAGTYLPQNSSECSTCPLGYACTGGEYILDTESDQGLTSCNSLDFADETGLAVCKTCPTAITYANYVDTTKHNEGYHFYTPNECETLDGTIGYTNCKNNISGVCYVDFNISINNGTNDYVYCDNRSGEDYGTLISSKLDGAYETNHCRENNIQCDNSYHIPSSLWNSVSEDYEAYVCTNNAYPTSSEYMWLPNIDIIQTETCVPDASDISIEEFIAARSKARGRYICGDCPNGTVWDGVSQCVVPEFDIIYDYTNGGSGCSNETYTLGTAKELTCVPTKDGYTFAGWFNSATGGNKITQITALDTGDKTFYAQWTENITPYNINYVLDGGTNYSGAPTSYTIQDLPIALGTPTKSGYSFNGWKDINGNTVSQISVTTTGNITLYAQWTDTETGCTTGHEAQITQSSAGIDLNPSTLASSATGDNSANTWTATVSGTSLSGISSCASNSTTNNASGDILNEAINTSNAANNTYCYCKLTDPAESSWVLAWKYSKATGSSGCPNKCANQCAYLMKNKTDSGGKTSTTFRNSLYSTTAADGEVSCESIVYNITYDLNTDDTNVNNNNPTTYIVEDLPITLNNPTRDGYTFTGWTDDDNNSVSGLSTGVFGNITLHANWEEQQPEITYNIYYDLQGGTNYDNAPTTYSPQGLPIILGTPTKYGYQFNGWLKDNTESITTIETGTEGDVYLTASWSQLSITCLEGNYLKANETECSTCKANWYCTGGTFSFSEDEDHGISACSTLGDGSYTKSSASAKSENACYKTCSKSCNISQTYPDYYTSYEVIESSTAGIEHYGMDDCDAEETSCSLTNVMCAPGYTSQAVVNIPEDTKPNSYEGVTSSVWSAQTNDFTIQGKAICSNTIGNGTGDLIYTTPVVDENSTNNNYCWCQITDPTISNWVFALKYTQASTCTEKCANQCGYQLKQSQNMRSSLYTPAYCTPQFYNITYDLDGGENYKGAPTNYIATDLPITLGVPTKEGYTFDGWLNEDADIVTTIEEGSTGDINLYASWTPLFTRYNITYDLDGGENYEGAPTSYIATDLPITLGIPTKEGYTFDGWLNEDADIVTTIEEGSTGDINLYASWSKGSVCPAGYVLIGGNSADISSFQATDKATYSAVIDSSTWEAIVNDTTLTGTAICSSSSTENLLSGEYLSGEPEIDTITPSSNANCYCKITNPVNSKWVLVWKYASASKCNDSTKCANQCAMVIKNSKDSSSTRSADYFRGALYSTATSIPPTCQPIEYNITYQLNDGINNTNNPNTYKVTDLPITLYPATRTNYTFKGWLYNNTIVTEIPKNTTGAIDLFAVWEEEITCNAGEYLDGDTCLSCLDNEDLIGWTEGVTSAPGATSIDDCKIVIPAGQYADLGTETFLGCLKDHYCTGGTYSISDFMENLFDDDETVGLTICPQGTTSEVNSTNLSQCLYPTWNITYIDGGEYNPNPKSYKANDLPIHLDTPRKTGYTFVEWQYTETQTKVSDIYEWTTGDITLTGIWIKNCNTNEFADGDSCKQCPINSTSTGGTVTSCSCTNQTEIWDTSLQTCVCNNDIEYYGTTGNCQICSTDDGNLWDDNTNTCVSICEDNQVWNGTDCISTPQCAPGQYLRNYECVNCPFGTTSNAGSTSIDACQCKPGYENPNLNLDPALYANNYSLLSNEEWRATFNTWTPEGISYCSSSESVNNSIGDISQYPISETEGSNCWCKMTFPATSEWIYTIPYSTASGCASKCNAQCGNKFKEGHTADTFRSNMYTTSNVEKACFKVEYEINYIMDDGGTNNSYNQTSYTVEDEVVLLNPLKEGYAFDGWYDTQDCVVSCNESTCSYSPECNGHKITTIPTGSMGDKTFYARWGLPQTYTITYNTDGGNIESSTTSYNILSSTIILPTPIKDDYYFEGWYTNENFSGEVVTEIPTGSTGNKTFWAKWTSCPIGSIKADFIMNSSIDGQEYVTNNENWSAIFDYGTINGTSACSSYTDDYSGISNTINAIAGEKTGANCWCKMTTPANSSWVYMLSLESTSACAEDCSEYCGLFAQTDSSIREALFNGFDNSSCIPIRWNISYVTNDGINHPDNVSSYTMNDLPLLIKSPNLDEAIFGGWYDNAQFTGDPITQITSFDTGDKTLYAKWSFNEYSIQYVLNGGTNYTNAPATYNITNIPLSLGTPSKPNATFDGWYDNEQFTGDTITQITSSNIGDKVLYAKFSCDAGFYEDENSQQCVEVEDGYYSEQGDNNKYSCAVTTGDDAYVHSHKDTNNLLRDSINDCYKECSKTCTKPQICSIDNASTCEYNEIISYGIEDYGASCNVDNIQCELTDFSCKNGYDKQQTSGQSIIINSREDVTYAASTSGSTWEATIAGTNVTGSAVCSNTPTANNLSGEYIESDPEVSSTISHNAYCYCKLTEPAESKWVLVWKYSQGSGCNKTSTTCANQCANTLKNKNDTGGKRSADFYRTALSETSQGSELGCVLRTYTITYDLDGGQFTSDEGHPTTYDVTTPSTIIASPEKSGYTFAGWCTDNDRTQNCSTTVRIGDGNTGDITLYAKWTPITISCAPGYYVQAGKTISEDICPANSYCPGEGSVEYSTTNDQCLTQCPAGYPYSETSSTSSNECYRQCTAADVAHSKSTGTFTGMFYSNNTNACEPVNDASCADGYHYKEGSTGLNVDASTAGVAYGYQNDSTGQYGPYSYATEKYGITEDQTWATEFSYGVVRGKALCSTTSGSFGETGTPDENESGQSCWCQIDGYTPVGSSKQSLSGAWVFIKGGLYGMDNNCARSCAYYCASSLQAKADFRAALLGSVGASPAICEISTYNITYKDGNTVLISTGNPSEYTYGIGATISNEPSKDGYIFTGWCTDATLTNCALTQTITTTDTDDKTFYAKFNIVEPSDEEIIPVDWCPKYEDTPAYDPVHFKTGANTGGVNLNQTTYSYYFYRPAKDLSGCQVFWLVDNSLIPNTASTFNGQPYTHTMIRAYYNKTTGNYEQNVQIQDTIGGNQTTNTLHCAQCNTYKTSTNGMFSYDTLTNALQLACTQTTSTGDILIESTCPAGSYCDDSCHIKPCPNGTTSPAGSTSIEQCVAPEYNIIYDYTNGGSGCSNETYTLGTAKDLTCEPTKEGYTFAGWFDAATGGNLITTIPVTSTGDITLYAQWTPTTYQITYELNDGMFTSDEGHPTTYDITTPSTLIASPEKSGYTFAGWCTDTARTQNCSTTVRIGDGNTGDITLYAKWEANTYNITYKDGNTVLTNTGNPSEYSYGIGATINNTPSKDSYIFTGWCTNVDLTNCSITPTISTTDTGDKTFYAQWQLRTTDCPSYYHKNDKGICVIDVTPGKCLVKETIAIVPHELLTNGTGNFGAKSPYQSFGSNGDSLSDNTFYTDFPYGTLFGESHCSTTWSNNGQGAIDTYNSINTDDWSAGNEDGGGQCWCRITGEQSLDSTEQTSLDLKWAFYGWQDDCHRYCANQCGYFLHNTETLRRGMFNFTEIQYKDCEAGYYCPNNTIPYNDDGCKQQLCPEGYTSDAGASSITQCYRTIQPGKSINDNYEEIYCPADKYCPNEVKVYYQTTQKSEIEVNCPTNYTSNPGSKTKQECYITASASEYADCGFEEVLIQSHTQSEYWHKEEGFSYPDNWNADNNSWAGVFYNNNVNEPGRTYVQGRSACSNLSSNKLYGTYTENEDIEFNPNTADGAYCWCKSETPTGSQWINVNYTQPYNNETDCWFQCSGLCANQMETVVAARKALHSVTTCKISTCPENHYCPSGVVHFGDEGNETIKPCPAGTISPAGSTSIEQCVVAACSANEYMEDNVCKPCPNDWFSPEGSIGVGSCGRILHIGDYSIYLRSQKRTTPSLNVDTDGDGNADFFGNMTPIPTNINKDSNRKVKIQYNNQLLYLYDDTIKVTQQ